MKKYVALSLLSCVFVAQGVLSKFPLRQAVKDKNIRIIELLIKNCADINADDDGRTPFSCAVYNGDYDIARLLRDHNANINPCDEGHSLVERILRLPDGWEYVAQWLVYHGASVPPESADRVKDWLTKKGLYAFLMAAKRNHMTGALPELPQDVCKLIASYAWPSDTHSQKNK